MIENIKNWNNVSNPNIGFMNLFNSSIMSLENKYPGIIPNIKNSPMVFIGSDSGGEHKTSVYESYSFIFVDLAKCYDWERERVIIRRAYLNDGRRMSYKSLKDNQRRKALIPFLNAANNIHGILFNININKNILSMFDMSNKISFKNDQMKNYSHWKPHSFEKLLRISHFISLFLAGLSNPFQDVLWITDEDEIASNDKRLSELVNIFAIVSSHYLNHTLKNLRIGTTKSDTGKRDVEDIVAITDLVSGAFSEFLTNFYKSKIELKPDYIIPVDKSVSQKARFILHWFSNINSLLKKIAFNIEEENKSKNLILTTINLKQFKIVMS